MFLSKHEIAAGTASILVAIVDTRAIEQFLSVYFLSEDVNVSVLS
jgi:hypothetical protein